MTTLVNSNYPYLRVLLPDDTFIQFQGGRLELPEDHPYYDHVMDVATGMPSIAILVNETTCIYCGEVFKGDKAAAKLDAHKKDIHFDVWEAESLIEAASVHQREVKSRAGHACDVCRPAQVFGSEDDLAEHIALLHTAAPSLDDDGNTLGGNDDDRRPGEVDAPKAARASTKTK